MHGFARITAQVALAVVTAAASGCASFHTPGSGQSCFQGFPGLNCLSGLHGHGCLGQPPAPAAGVGDPFLPTPLAGAAAPVTAPPAAPAPVVAAPPADLGVDQLRRRETLSSKLQGHGDRKYENSALVLSPEEIIAPVGGQVVLRAEVLDQNGSPAAHKRVEWLLETSGVGHFLNRRFGKEEHFFGLLGPSEARKVDRGYTIGRTSKFCSSLTRGTPTRVDDVDLKKGEAWAAVTSAAEGVSYVTAWSPDVRNWDRRQKHSVIHWIDAQWNAPPPSMNPAASPQTLVTTAARRSDNSPLVDWQVRYTVLPGGPAAGFAPNGATTVEVPTDALGQAGVELTQLSSPQSGVNQIQIELIRPANASLGQSKPLVVGGTTTQHTWTAPDVMLQMSGPLQATAGSTVRYRINVTNTGQSPARAATIDYAPPPTWTIVETLPAADASSGRLVWRLADLPAGQSQAIEITATTTQAGPFTHCAHLATGEGLEAQDCVSTTIVAPAVQVTVVGPSKTIVGDEAVFRITVENRGDSPLANLQVHDEYPAGLEFAAKPGASGGSVVNDLQTLAPRSSQAFELPLIVRREGRLCHRVSVRDASGGELAVAEACVDGVAAPPEQGGPAGTLEVASIGLFEVIGSGASESLRTTPQLAVGQTGLIRVVVRNRGAFAARGVQTAATFAASIPLAEAQATDGFVFEPGGRTVSWTADSIAPNEEKIYELRFPVVQASPEVCVDVVSQAEGGSTATDRGCFQFVAGSGAGAAPPLRISAVATPSTTAPGRPTRLEISVTNTSQQNLNNMQLAVVLPAGLNATTATAPRNVNFRLDGRSVLFDPVRSQLGQETLDFSIDVQAAAAGSFPVTLRATAAGYSTPVQSSAQVAVQAGS